MTDGVAERRPAPIRDLFATAVHRYGNAWADLAVATAVIVVLSTGLLLIISRDGVDLLTAGLVYGVAYFVFLGFVLLRGLPQRASGGRVAATYLAAVLNGLAAGFVTVGLVPLSIAVLPLFFFVVPAVAAGDAGLDAAWRGPALALRSFSRTWAVWLITLVFSMPVIVSVFLVVSNLGGVGTSILLALAISAPILWPVSALFVRAIYGDLTGRAVVAPQDRSDL